MSEKDIQRAVNSSIASIEMEGYTVDAQTKELCIKLMRKEITMDEYLAFVKQSVGVIA